HMFLGLAAGAFILPTDTSRGAEVNSAGYSAALYHLFNHAFFKALLFLSAGSVIHAVDTNNMREMGGLSAPMPVTSRVMLFGALALAGMPPFSGFFSKGDILSVAFDAGADQPGFYLLYAFGLLLRFLPPSSAFALGSFPFAVASRGPAHRHEPPRVLPSPLLFLAGSPVGSGPLAS